MLPLLGERGCRIALAGRAVGRGGKSSSGAVAEWGACRPLTRGISSWGRADLQHREMVVGVQAIPASPNDHKTFYSV